MEILAEIKVILADILDIEQRVITPETYIVRELGAESIDLLELAVSLNSRFGIEVDDDEIFLTKLRVHVTEAEKQGKDLVRYVIEKLPFLSKSRTEEIITDLKGGPTLKVKDLINYIKWKRQDG